MKKPEPKLNAKQLQLLKIIYLFRFVTPSLLAEYRGVLKWTIQNTLNILMKNGYVTRRYSKTYKIDRKPASYHLTLQAIKRLREEPDINKQVLHTRYKDRSLSQAFIDHNLNVMRMYLDITKAYPNTYSIFTKTELADYDYFPEPLPDLYLQRINPDTIQTEAYIIDTFSEHNMNFIIKKRIDVYFKHYEDEGWLEGYSYPNVIILVSSSTTVASLNRYIEKKMDDEYIDKSDINIVAQSSLEI